MSAKMLVIEARIPIPDGLFESNEIISEVRKARDVFEQALTQTIGGAAYELTVNTVTKRAPRAPGSTKPGRKPKANGQAAAATA